MKLALPGDVPYAVHVFDHKHAVRYGLTSWSLSILQREMDDLVRIQFLKAFSTLAKDIGLSRVYAPMVRPANAVILPEAGVVSDDSDFKVSIIRDPNTPADGLFIRRGESVIMSSAGCPVIVAYTDARMVVAHAGRDSLIDRATVMDDPTKRRHVSVVDAIVDAYRAGDAAETLRNVHMDMLLAIPSEKFLHSFYHPRYGEYNRKLYTFAQKRAWGLAITGDREYLWRKEFPLDLELLFLMQSLEAGIPGDHVTTSHNLRDHTRLAHTRDGGDPARRNLVIVTRMR